MSFIGRVFFCVALCLIIFSNADAYTIHGRLKGFSPKWKNRIYLAAIRSINYFEAASESLKINEAVIDSLGNFKLQGNNLPEENSFYRVYLADTNGAGMQLLMGKDHNYIHLLLNNGSDVLINADLTGQPFYEARITGSPYAAMFADFYKQIYYLGSQNFDNVYIQIHLDQQKTYELTKKSINKNRNPYYTIFALAHINWTSQYPSDPDFFEKAVSDLKSQLPNNSYVQELDDKLRLIAFQRSPFKHYLNARNFIALLCICGLLMAVVIYLLLRLRTKASVSLVTEVPAERLTQKELEIANLVAQGKSNKEISGLLFIEISTVKSHVSNIYQKLNISGRQELTDKIKAS